jgi:hypothetical protein
LRKFLSLEIAICVSDMTLFHMMSGLLIQLMVVHAHTNVSTTSSSSSSSPPPPSIIIIIISSSSSSSSSSEWRKLHYEELHDPYSLSIIARIVKSRSMIRAGHVARMEDGRGVHRILVGKYKGRRTLGSPRRR